MKTWVIGDIHGCEETFVALIAQMELGPRDKVICIGDLINRGPRSGQILDRFCNDTRFSAVLGNHDWAFILSKLARSGPVHDDFRGLAESSRSLIWISWLRRQPFAQTIGNFFLTHAGCWPEWGLEEHQKWADQLHYWFKRCSIDELKILDAYLYSENKLCDQDPEKNPIKFYAFLINVLTKTRYIESGSPISLNLGAKGAPEVHPNLRPWFEEYPVPNGKTIVFGHWSGLKGLQRPGFQGIDTGCVWGEALTAIELTSMRRIIQPALERR